ncbi:MAG: AsmA-like C-terminal region-containing protein [Calditrichia bacterium]
MKIFLKIFGIFILIIIALMIIIPLFFKDNLVNLVKEKANEQLNAKLQFEDFGMNLFSSFPDISLSAKNISIVNKAPFAGDTLARMEALNIVVDLWSAVFGDQIIVKGVSLEQPDLLIFVAEDSSANYEIFNETEETDTTAGMKFDLRHYEINNGNLAYIDKSSDIRMIMRNINHSGSGNFSANKFEAVTETEVEELTYEMEGITYLSKATADLEMKLRVNVPEQKYTLLDNELLLNQMPLNFDGYFKLLDNGTEMDLKFSTPEASLTQIISMIPADFAENTADLESSGAVKFNGYAKGVLTEESLPEFKVNLDLTGGRLKNSDMPAAIENLDLNMIVENPGGSNDATILNISRFSFNLSGEPFTGNLLVKNFDSGPVFDTALKGRVNLAEIKNALKLEDVETLSGTVTADFTAAGSLANLEKNRAAEDISARGKIQFSNIVYKAADLEEIRIKSGNLNLTPQKINLNNFSSVFGESDLNASGELNNVFSYVLSDGILAGKLSLTSSYLNLNPFMASEGNAGGKGEENNIESIELPANINFTASAKINTLVYDNLTMKNVNGIILLKNSRLSLQNFRTELLNGVMTASGYYEQKEGALPQIAFDLDISEFNIKDTFEKFVTVQRFAPMAQYISGNFGAKLNLNTPLDSTMTPLWNSFRSNGTLNLNRAEIQDFKPFEILGNKLNMEDLKNPVIKDVHPSFKVENGRLIFSPFTYQVADYTTTLSGSNGMDGSLNYQMAIDIPASGLKKSANQAIGNILNTDLNLIKSNQVTLTAQIGGSIQSPNVAVKAGDIISDTREQVTETVKQEVKSQVDTLKKDLQKKAKEKLKDLFK